MNNKNQNVHFYGEKAISVFSGTVFSDILAIFLKPEFQIPQR